MKSLHLPTIRVMLAGDDKLPAEFQGEFPAVQVSATHRWNLEGTFDFKVLPTPPTTRKSSRHRVLVKCGCCGGYVPAGRLHQHRPACEAKATAGYDAATR